MGTNSQKELYASSGGSGARAHPTSVLDPSLHVAISHASFSFVESYTTGLYCSLLQNAVSQVVETHFQKRSSCPPQLHGRWKSEIIEVGVMLASQSSISRGEKTTASVNR
jgi:hypothetical protein